MEPFLRRATPAGALAKPAPDGWAVEPAGRWRDRCVEVVYDPARHDVLFHRGNTPPKLRVLDPSTGAVLLDREVRYRQLEGPSRTSSLGASGLGR